MKIDQIAILVVTEDGTVQEFVKNKKDYLHLLDEALEVYSLKDNAQGLTAN